MAYTHEKHKLLKAKTLENYNKVGLIYCPYFQEYVHFNNMGIEHLLYRDKSNKRPESDQYVRMKLLYLAPAIISLSHTLQDYGTKVIEGRIAKYYIFTALLNTTSVKVVVRQVGNSSKYFFSIIPHWKRNKFYMMR